MVKLDFTYAWSNRSPSDKAIIAGALMRPYIPDLTRLALHHGMPALREVAAELESSGQVRGISREIIHRLLNNVEIGIRRAQERRDRHA